MHALACYTVQTAAPTPSPTVTSSYTLVIQTTGIVDEVDDPVNPSRGIRICIAILIAVNVSLGTLVPNSRDRGYAQLCVP